MWVIGGYSGSTYLNDVWSSTDGVNWNEATANAAFSGRAGLTSFVFNNAMWVIGGDANGSFLNDAWFSTDGVHWTEANASASFAGRDIHSSVVFNNAMWVIAGYDGNTNRLNDVWYSP